MVSRQGDGLHPCSPARAGGGLAAEPATPNVAGSSPYVRGWFQPLSVYLGLPQSGHLKSPRTNGGGAFATAAPEGGGLVQAKPCQATPCLAVPRHAWPSLAGPCHEGQGVRHTAKGALNRASDHRATMLSGARSPAGFTRAGVAPSRSRPGAPALAAQYVDTLTAQRSVRGEELIRRLPGRLPFLVLLLGVGVHSKTRRVRRRFRSPACTALIRCASSWRATPRAGGPTTARGRRCR